MRSPHFSWAMLAVLFVLFMAAPPEWAAQGSDVFGAPSGVNSNLQASGNTLDLSGVPWANNPWPVSGTTLAAGDYYFGSANLGNGYQLNVADGAQVRIFINGSQAFGNNIAINAGGDPGQLLLVTRGSLTLGNNAQVNGLLYAAGSISVGNNAVITGGLAAGGGISTGNTGPVADYSGIEQGLLAGLCARPVELSANGDSVGPVTVEVGDAVSLSVTGEGCPSAGFLRFLRWEDRWSIDGVQDQSSTSDVSLCERSPVNRTVTFDSPGDYSVRFESVYRDCSIFFGCLGASVQSFGQDEIIISVTDPSDGLTCFVDDFDGGSLSTDDWVTSVASGSFTPSVVNNRLRMTQAVSNQSTAATLQREIPGADNLVILEFDYFAYGGSGADGLAIVLSDSAITPQPGSFGGSLGYAQRDNGDPGFAGGWLGIGLDEFGNFSNPTEGRQGGPGSRADAVAIRGAYQGNYRYLRGTNTLSPGIDQAGTNPTAQRYRITVDSRLAGQAIVSVERDTSGSGNNFQTLIAPFNALAEPGQPAVPENFLLSLTGSTGGSTNIHELGNIELCALKLNPVGQQVDHFEIIHDGVALTCQPETVQVRACGNADCSELFTDPVQATLAPANGWQGGNVVSLVNGFGEATLQNTSPGTVRLDVVGSNPSTRPQAVTLCQIGGSLSASNCDLPFFESGLAFDLPDLISHRPSGPVQVRAVRQDDVNQQCVPAFANQTKAVEFWSEYVDPGPGGRDVSRAVSVNGAPVGIDASAPAGIDLSFDGDGVAEIDVIYPDAGQMQLNVLYRGSEATEDAGLLMPGADSFVSVPAGFCVSAAVSCSQGDETCPLFRRAGEFFDLTITAAGWQSDTDVDFCAGSPVTPNFELPGIPLQVELVAPAGGETGVVSPGSYDHARAVDAQTTVAVDQSEVGVFRFLTSPAPGAYLGRDLPQGRSAPVGRFYPDRFRVTVDPGAFEAECGAGQFTYTGQPFGWLMAPTALLEPLSVQGGRTRNYTFDGFRRLSVAGVSTLVPIEDLAATDANGDPMAFSVTQEAAALSVQEPGLILFSFNPNDQFEYPKSPVTRIEPFLPQLEFTVTSVQDTDGVQAEAAPYDFEPEASFDIRYGRLIMENVYGPETVEALFMPFRVESFEGGRFVTHDADSCTTWTTTDIDSAETHHALLADSGVFDQGTAGPLRLEPLGTQGTDLLTWDVPEWLEDDWNNDGVLADPSATATFGVYRGNDRIIYWREVPAN